jgi:hypothetical protein
MEKFSQRVCAVPFQHEVSLYRFERQSSVPEPDTITIMLKYFLPLPFT